MRFRLMQNRLLITKQDEKLASVLKELCKQDIESIDLLSQKIKEEIEYAFKKPEHQQRYSTIVMYPNIVEVWKTKKNLDLFVKMYNLVEIPEKKIF